MKTCPFTYKKLTRFKYAPSCGLSYEMARYKYLMHNFPLATRENIEKEYVVNLHSLPQLNGIFGMDYNSLLWLIDYYGLPRRNQREGCKIGNKKQQKTLSERYGKDITNISQISSVKQAKKKTSLKNYGVENIWKHPDYMELRKEGVFKNYGTPLNVHLSLKGREVWASKTEEERRHWLKTSILQGKKSSNLEVLIVNHFLDYGIKLETQFLIASFVYDIFIPSFNMLVEINGDYWHANPIKYKACDIVAGKLASDIWKHDKRKKELAENKGYLFLTLWEYDINKAINIKELINAKIENLFNNQN